MRGLLNKTIVMCSVLTLMTEQVAFAQKGKFDPTTGVKARGMVPPTVIDKMLATNLVLGKGKVNWKSVGKGYVRYLNRDNYKDRSVVLPAVMGLRMSDGVLSIMAKDVELLNKSAADIEFFANKLDAKKGTFKRANKVKAYANRGDWSRVFLELGYLQKEVLDTLDSRGNRDRRAILLAAGWLEGAHVMSSVILANYNKETAALLREPLLVKQMIYDIEALGVKKKKDPIVEHMLRSLKRLHEIVDVPLHGSVSKPGIEEMQKITSSFRQLVIKSKR